MDDLISRVAAIEYMMTNMGWHDEDGYEVDDGDEKRKVITDWSSGIPAVDAAPVVHAQWVFHDDDIMPWVSCSECDVCTDSTNKTPYCPYCGAKMDGEADA